MTSEFSPKFDIKPAAPDDYARISQYGRVVARSLKWLSNEIRSPVRIPLNSRLRGWRHGFGKLATLVYQLDRNEPRLYISGFQQAVLSTGINGHYDHILNNKLLFPHLMRSLGLETPDLIGFMRNGVLHDSDGKRVERLSDWLLETLESTPHIVVKPAKGQKGRGLAFVSFSNGAILVNGHPAALSEATALLRVPSDTVITNFAAQADYAQEMYPATPNTIRVLTIWDYRKGEPFILAAAQRIGTRKSFPTDNWLAGLGGLSSKVDLSSGSLSSGAMVSSAWDLVWYARHPETNTQIEGTVVDGWAEIDTRLVAAARKVAWAPQIAWDILVTGSGFTVIEINGTPGLAVHQVHEPLLSDVRARDFYRAHGVIK